MSCWWCRGLLWALVIAALVLAAPAIAGSGAVAAIVSALQAAGSTLSAVTLTSQVTTGLITLIGAGAAVVTDWLCCRIGVQACCD
jgi:hypothetical protein